jgi:hypothetical protein
MPEQDDDALGDILSDRLKGTRNGAEEDETDGGDEREEATEADESPPPEDDGSGEAASGSAAADSSGGAGSPRSTQITDVDADSDAEAVDGDATEGTAAADDAAGPGALDAEHAVDDDTTADEDAGTTRSRSPFPLYIQPSLKESVDGRFDRFNAERTLDDEPQVEKHAHFIQGLLRAGLDHPDLEEYVLEEFREE